MKKLKKIIKLCFMAIIILNICTGCKKNEKIYNFGEIIKVKLNDTLEKEFYVIKDEGETLKLLSKDSIGKSTYNDIQEGYGCQFYGDCQPYNKYEGSIIESKIKELTKDWTNVQSVSLLNIEDLIEPISISNKYFYKRSNSSIEINEEYKEIFTGDFWLYNTYMKSINLAWKIKDSSFETLSITEKADIRPIIIIEKFLIQ